MPNEKVSVIISTLDRPKKLKRAIESVLNQTYKNFEIVVVGDCCAEPTGEMISTYFSNNVKYINLPSRHGLQDHGSTPKNVGIQNSDGEYISYLDDDDVYFSNHLEKSVEFLKSNPEIDMVYGGSRVFKFLDTRKFVSRSREWDYDHHIKHPFINTCEVVHRRDIVDILGKNLWNVVGYYNDYDLWKRMAEVSEIKHSDHLAATQHFDHETLLRWERQRLRRLGGDLPKISVVIGTRNRNDYLKHVLLSLRKQNTEYPFEIIVVDQGGKEDSFDLCMSISKEIRHFRLENNGPYHRGWVCNYASKMALSDVFCFLDADCVPAENFVETICKKIDEINTDKFCLYTRVSLLGEEHSTKFKSGEVSYNEAVELAIPNPNKTALGATHTVHRNAFFAIRGFDEIFDKGWGLEDVDIHDRLEAFGCKDYQLYPETSCLHLWHPTSDHPKEERGEHYHYYKKLCREKQRNPEKFIKRNLDYDWGQPTLRDE